MYRTSTLLPQKMCQQHDARCAMTYSLASALYYHGLQDKAFKLASKATSFACLRYLDMLPKIKEHMQLFCEVTEFPKDHKRRKKIDVEVLYHGKMSSAVFSPIQPLSFPCCLMGKLRSLSV